MLLAIVTTGMLLVVSFVIANIAYKQLIITSSSKESQSAFYIADSGVECATYWDVKNRNNPSVSSFATTTEGSVITCNGQSVGAGYPPQTVPSNPPVSAVIGGAASITVVGGVSKGVSIFKIDFSPGCAIVTIIKDPNGDTTINSKGYNTCDPLVSRRFERGIIVMY